MNLKLGDFLEVNSECLLRSILRNRSILLFLTIIINFFSQIEVRNNIWVYTDADRERKTSVREKGNSSEHWIL